MNCLEIRNSDGQGTMEANLLTLKGRLLTARLRIELKISVRGSRTDHSYKSAVEMFFRALAPLSSLCITGILHRDWIPIICEQHGSTLLDLIIAPINDYYNNAGPPFVIEAEDIEVLSRSCPRLSRLDLWVKRTKGDNRETRCYEALGALRSLKSAKIHLDCVNNPITIPTTFQAGLTTGRGSSQIEQALINSAVDEPLVHSIWDIVTGSDAKSRLETLEITSSGGSSFGNGSPGDLMQIVGQMSRSYIIKRRTTESEWMGPNIVETSKARREQSLKRQLAHEQVMLEKWGNNGNTGSAYDAMDRLWGLDKDHSNWREVWKSFPLQRSN